MLKRKLKNKLINYLFNTITDDDVISYTRGGKMMIDGETLTEAELSNLAQEAVIFREMRLSKILHGTVMDKAKKSIFTNSRNTEDIFAGKMLLLSLDTQNKIINKLADSN